MRIAIFGALAITLLTGCARRPPTKVGAVLVDWSGGPSGPSPQATKRLRLRDREAAAVFDVECLVGATAKELTRVRCVLLENQMGTHVEAQVMQFPSGTKVASVLLHGTKTGPWTVRGSGYSYGATYLEVHSNAQFRQPHAEILSCATPKPAARPGAENDLCEL